MSTHCLEVEAQRQVLSIYGFGLPGQGFYYIQIPEKKGQKNKEEYGGVMLIKEGVANYALVREELKTYDEE
jgi:hypothetical protein